MYLLTYHVLPSAEHPETNELGGAYVNCFIERKDLLSAEQTARQLVENERWEIDKLDNSQLLESENDVGDEKLEYYRQALIDKEVLVFHSYPINEKST